MPHHFLIEYFNGIDMFPSGDYFHARDITLEPCFGVCHAQGKASSIILIINQPTKPLKQKAGPSDCLLSAISYYSSREISSRLGSGSSNTPLESVMVAFMYWMQITALMQRTISSQPPPHLGRGGFLLFLSHPPASQALILQQSWNLTNI